MKIYQDLTLFTLLKKKSRYRQSQKKKNKLIISQDSDQESRISIEKIGCRELIREGWPC